MYPCPPSKKVRINTLTTTMEHFLLLLLDIPLCVLEGKQDRVDVLGLKEVFFIVLVVVVYKVK